MWIARGKENSESGVSTTKPLETPTTGNKALLLKRQINMKKEAKKTSQLGFKVDTADK